MLTPDLTYSFRAPKDVSGPTFEVLTRQFDLSDTSATLIFTFDDLPKDRMLVLSNVAILANPGAGQSVIGMGLHGITAAGMQFDISRFAQAIVADLTESFNWQGQVFITGGGRGTTCVRITVSFSSGVAANTCAVGIHGVVIPRANAGPF